MQLNHMSLHRFFILSQCFVFYWWFYCQKWGSILLHTCFFHSVEWNQILWSSKFILFMFLSFRVLSSFSSSNLFLFSVIILKNGARFHKSSYSFMPSFSTANIISCFVFLSVKRMEPGTSSDNMFFFFMLFHGR